MMKRVFSLITVGLIMSACSNSATNQPSPAPGDTAKSQAESSAPISSGESKQSTASSDIVTPATYQLTVQGETEAGAFSEIQTVLELQPASAPDQNSILVSVYPADPRPNNLKMGHFFWQSYTAGLPTADEHFSRVTVEGAQVSMSVNPVELAIGTTRSDVMWFTQAPNLLADIPSMPEQSGRVGAIAQTGALTFQVEGDRITGEVTLSGTSDLGTPSTYQATFTGQAM